MAQDGKIYITISDQRGTTPQPDATPSAPSGKKKSDKDLLQDYMKHKFYNFVEQQAKQFVDYSISNIGNFQGDFQTQREIQNAVSIGNSLLGIASAAKAGAMVGGGAGALVGAGVALAVTTINAGYSLYTGYVKTNQQNRSIEQLAKLSGLSTLTNGSR